MRSVAGGAEAPGRERALRGHLYLSAARRARMTSAAGSGPSLLRRPLATSYRHDRCCCGCGCGCGRRHLRCPVAPSLGGGGRTRRSPLRASWPLWPRNISSTSLWDPPSFYGSSGLFNSLGCGMNFQAQRMASSQVNITAPIGIVGPKQGPDHLLVLVHGILASPSDWLYAESELKRQLGRNFIIYVSSSNTYTKTFSGIDEAGRRLADEVMQVVKNTDGLKRISFLAHSLGGLFTRYAVAVLYSKFHSNAQRDHPGNTGSIYPNQSQSFPISGSIAGLAPVSFVTLASPHLGVRGRKQLPFLLGVTVLEKLAAPMAPILVGQTGSQLFLTDGKPSKPPLLLRMASDCEDLKFLSALGSFKYRMLYANVAYDHMVGWRTSSIRRETELVKPPRRSIEGYKHVVNVEYCPPVLSEKPHFTIPAAKAKEAVQALDNSDITHEYHHIMEEETIRGLQRLGWTKVDVSFHSTFFPFFAHNNIHVKNEWVHNAGTGVIAHVADNLKRQEFFSFIPASL